MSALPDQLLNRVNVELKRKVEKLRETSLERTAEVRVEQEVMAATLAQLSEAKSKMASLKRVEAQTAEKLFREQQQAADLKATVEKLKADKIISQGRCRDMSDKVQTLSQALETIRRKIANRREIGAKHEATLMEWLQENQLSQAASSVVDGVAAEKKAMIDKLRLQSESLVSKVRLLDEEASRESATLGHVEDEIHDAREAAERHRREYRDVVAQLQEVIRRQEETAKMLEDRQAAQAAAHNEVLKHREDRDRVRAEFNGISDQRSRIEKMFQKQIDEENRKRLGLQQACAEAEECELQVSMMQQSLFNAQQRRRQLQQEIVFLKSKVEDHAARLQRTENRATELAEEVRRTMEGEKALDEETSTVDALLAAQKEELKMQVDTIERGMAIIQAELSKRAQNSRDSDNAGKEIQRLREALKKARAREELLTVRQGELDAANESVDVNIAEMQTKIKIFSDIVQEQSAEVRREKMEEARRLQEEYSAIELEWRASRAAMDSALSAVRRSEAEMRDLEGAMKSVEEDMEERTIEISQLHAQIEAQRAQKQKSATLAEDLLWRVEKGQHALAGLSRSIAEKQKDRRLFDMEIMQREAVARAEIQALTLECHLHEDDRRKLGQRFNAAKAQVRTLQSRHDDLLQTMQLRVFPEGEKTTDGGLDATPEELHARAILKRAVERDALQQRGDALDRELVIAEKELRTAEAAFALLHTAPPDEPLMLEDEHVERYIEDLRSTLAVRALAPSANELLQVETNLARSTQQLAAAQRRQAEVRQQLDEAVQRRDTLRQRLRGLEREASRAALAQANNEAEVGKLSSAVAVKHQAFYSHPQSARAVSLASAADKISDVAHRLHLLVGKFAEAERNDQIYFAYRRLVDKYDATGVLTEELMAPPAPQSTLPTVARVESSSSVGRGPPAYKGRPATRALVESVANAPLSACGTSIMTTRSHQLKAQQLARGKGWTKTLH